MIRLLTARSIRVEFGPLVAVRDVSFELSGGQLLGLVGPNGAGKTTLLRVCAGLHPPTGGQAQVMDRPVLGEDELVRRHIGFAPDSPPAYDDVTVRQFLEFIAGAYDLSRSEAAERIHFWLEQLWLSARRDTKIKELSRGMKQCVTLARTFLPQPHVLLLDEPLAGLDPAGRIQLRQVLGMLRDQGCAMMVSSHILSDLEEVATHIAIIEHGSILRWSETSALHHEDRARRTYRLFVVEDADRGAAILNGIEGVAHVRQNGTCLTFDFAADEHRAVALLKQLIQERLAVWSFTVVKKTLEDAYLQAGVKQVD